MIEAGSPVAAVAQDEELDPVEGVCERFDNMVGSMEFELVFRKATGGNREASGTDGMGARDVFGSVADDESFLGSE